MATVVRVEQEARQRFVELELDPEVLRRAVEASEMAADTCTAHDPPGFRGYTRWGVCTREVRMGLTPLGWTRRNRQNLPLTVSPDGTWAIAVATGDAGTGLPDATPHTKHPRGKVTRAVILENLGQLSLFDLAGNLHPDPGAESPILTWMLLYYRDHDIIRCELSLPSAWDDDGRPAAWAERLILDPVGVVDRPAIPLEEEPAIDVEVERKYDQEG